MIVLMFDLQFADAVTSGRKLQTIRRPRRKPINIGDAVSLRRWANKGYRSKQIVLGHGTITEVCEIAIGEVRGALGVFDDAGRLGRNETRRFVEADGFTSEESMLAWFRETYQLPFSGQLISWKLREA